MALLSLKYNCAVLFLSQMYWSFIYASKTIFSYATILSEFSDLSKKDLLNFPQGVLVKSGKNFRCLKLFETCFEVGILQCL